MRQVARSALQKICVTCGRQISWRKKWEKSWPTISHCSTTCRKNKIKPNSLDLAFESKIISLLSQRRVTRGRAASITCEEAEEEVVRDSVMRVEDGESKGKSEERTRERSSDKKMAERTRERCRQAARRLVARGEIVITQEGRVVEPSFAKGGLVLKFPS